MTEVFPFSVQARFQHIQFVTVFPRWSFASPHYTTASVLFNTSSLPLQNTQRLFLFKAKKKKTEERKKEKEGKQSHESPHWLLGLDPI